jgi:hypothetical protein
MYIVAKQSLTMENGISLNMSTHRDFETALLEAKEQAKKLYHTKILVFELVCIVNIPEVDPVVDYIYSYIYG